MRILYIEDEVKLARFVQRALDEEGYLTDVATDGENGFQMARSQQYHIVIVDNLLPKMTGVEICRQLRGEGHKMPILMLTALDSTEHKVTGLDSGADDYLVKPFALEELSARIRALLRRRQDRISLITVDDLTLDVVSREVHRSNKLIQLSAREFSLLEFLMRNQGIPLSRSSITESVWGLDFDPETNVVDVYINYLRTKLDTDRGRKLIRTVRGVGYSIG